MIIGKLMYDSEIIMDLKNKSIKIFYGLDPISSPSILKLVFLLPFKSFFALYFVFIHRNITIPLIINYKLINQNKYLEALNSLYIFAFGYKTKTFYSPSLSNSIQVESNNNLLFDYSLSGEFSSLCTQITLTEERHERTILNKTYSQSKGWVFTIYFSSPPQTGEAIIKYT